LEDVLCRPELDIRKKLLSYIEEALKINKGESLLNFSDTVEIAADKKEAR
jgi:hypothetical protein